MNINANMQREELDSQFAFFTADFEELLSSLDVSNSGKVIKKEIVSNYDCEKKISSFDKILDHEGGFFEIGHTSQDIHSTDSVQEIPTFPEEAGLTLCSSTTGKDDSLLCPSSSVRRFSISSEPLDPSVAVDSATTRSFSFSRECSPFQPTPAIAGYIDVASKLANNSLAHNLISPSPLGLSPSPLRQQHRSTKEIRARSNSAPLFQSFKKYACQICEKRFKRPSSLSTHMNIHTGQKPHLCPLSSCGKPFNAKSNMLRHYKIHFKIAAGEYLLPSSEVTTAKPTSRQLLLHPGFQFTAQPSPNYKRDSNFERRSF